MAKTEAKTTTPPEGSMAQLAPESPKVRLIQAFNSTAAALGHDRASVEVLLKSKYGVDAVEQLTVSQVLEATQSLYS